MENLTFYATNVKYLKNKYYKNYKNVYLNKLHKTLLLKTKNCKINNFNKIYKTLFFENKVTQSK